MDNGDWLQGCEKSRRDGLMERLRVAQEWFDQGHGNLHKEAANRIEYLEGIMARVNHTVSLHGKMDADTPLHAEVQNALVRP